MIYRVTKWVSLPLRFLFFIVEIELNRLADKAQ